MPYTAQTLFPWTSAGEGGSSGFVPSDLTDLQFWAKADQITGLSDGDGVATWEDQSGNSRNATSGVTTRPTYQTNEVNGLPGVLFNGTSQFFDITSYTGTEAQPLTAFVVCRTVADADQLHLFDNNNGTNRVALVIDTANKPALYAGSTQIADGTITDAVAVYITAIYDGSSSLVSFNGGTTTSGNPGTQGFGASKSIGSVGGGSASWFNGLICEIILYGRRLTTGEITQVQDYIEAKYAL